MKKRLEVMEVFAKLMPNYNLRFETRPSLKGLYVYLPYVNEPLMKWLANANFYITLKPHDDNWIEVSIFPLEGGDENW